MIKYIILALILSGCSSKIIVRDCVELGQDLFDCEKI